MISSTSCWIIGEFATADAAQAASNTVKSVLDRIQGWNETHEDEDEWEYFWASADWLYTPTPIEAQIASEYGLNWPGALSWTSDYKIQVIENRLVVLSLSRRPDSTGVPINDLMDRLGGKGFIHWTLQHGEDLAWILLDLTCTAPDRKTAEAIRGQYLGFHRRIRQDGNNLHFYRWRLDEMPHLETLLQQLQASHIENIRYSFTQYNLDAPPFALHDETDLPIMRDLLQMAPYKIDKDDAAEFVGELRDAQAVEHLVALLDEEGLLRNTAMVALARIGDPHALEPMLARLNNSDILTRHRIIPQLANFDISRVVPVLIGFLSVDDAWDIASLTLGRIGESVTASLTPLLQTEDALLRERVERTLEHVKETKSTGKQLEILRTGAFEKRQDQFIALTKEIDGNDILLAYLRDPGIHPDFTFQNQVLDYVLSTGDERLIDVLANRVLYMGSAGMVALTQIGPAAVPTLLELYKTHSEQWVRESALLALAEIGDPRSFDVLIEALNSDDNINRSIAARGLKSIGDPKAIPALVDAYFIGLDRWHPDIEKSILEAIDYLGGTEQFVDTLLQRLESSSMRTVQYIWTLGQIGDPRVIASLEKIMEKADNPIKGATRLALNAIASRNA